MAKMPQQRRRTAVAGAIIAVLVLLSQALPLSAAEGQSTLVGSILSRASRLRSSFTFAPLYPAAGQAVQFMDTSTGGPSTWAWDFGDGATSADRHPSHAYATAGFYTAALTVSDGATARVSRRMIAVVAGSTFTASFTYAPIVPVTGQAVQFTDTSTGGPSSWLWTFGDGTISTLRNPVHTYATAGFKTVSLTATDSFGSKTARRMLTVGTGAGGEILTASFSFSPSSPVAGQAVQFTDLSTGAPTAWLWNFGDGGTSTVQNPSHAYAAAGTKTVSLTVTNEAGTNTSIRTLTVTAPLAASFGYSPAVPVTGQPVQFTDTSTGTPTAWLWSFGDGATSTLQNPSHAYASAGAKTVTLTVTNATGSASTNRIVSVVTAVAAAFTFSPATPVAGQTVAFTDTSTGTPTAWLWNFGDGTSSTQQNPSHAYASAGTRTVALTVTNAAGSSSTTRTISVLTPLAASFTFSPATPVAGQTVAFTDTSTGTPTAWLWRFGDGVTSTVRNPSHAFASAGTYSVSLTVTNASGSASASRTVTVTPAVALAASFTFSPTSPTAGQPVQFTDTSTGTPTSWLWNFNDGSTSTTQNPSHAFSAAGTYSVSLTVTNATSSDSTSRTVIVTPVITLTASFTYSPASPTVGQSVQFADTSTGTPTSWLWSFGDGTTSSAQNPSHAYSSIGSKTVTLTVANATVTSNVSKTVTVVSASSIIANHTSAKLDGIPSTWIEEAKEKLVIAYGHTSHGSQLTTGMTGLVAWQGDLYAWSEVAAAGALELRDFYYNFGAPDVATVAHDLGNPNRTAWAAATREYLAVHPEVNVIIWSWCWQVNGTEAEIQLYLDLMSGLERDFPGVKFVYMTGHTDGTGLTGNVHIRNNQIRNYCLANSKILYDFEDIESYDPDGAYFGDKLVNDACDYDSNGDGIRDRNWAIDWQNAHPGEWYDCEAAHTQPLNANLKAYAAWWLWARLAGWDGN